MRTVEQYREDFPLYAKDCLKIVDKRRTLRPFVLNRAQRRVWSLVKEDLRAGIPIRYYLLKARQLGMSTFIKGIEFWKAALNPNIQSLTTAHNTDAVHTLHLKHQVFYGMLPDGLRPTRKRSNRAEVYFAKDGNVSGDIGLQSRLLVGTFGDRDVGVSMTLSLLHMSEFARYDQTSPKTAISTLAALLQCVPKEDPESMVWIETTGMGLGLGHDWWQKDNEYRKVFISWCADDAYRSPRPIPETELEESGLYGNEVEARAHILRELAFWYPENESDPGWYAVESLHRLAWRREKIRDDFNNDIALFQREYPLTAEEAWASSGAAVFDVAALSFRRSALVALDPDRGEIKKAPVERYRMAPAGDGFHLLLSGTGPIRVYERPREGKTYVVGVDASECVDPDADDAALTVLRVPGLVQVAAFHGQIPPDDLADLAYLVGMFYNGAAVCPEATGPGLVTTMRLSRQLRYPWLYTRLSLDDYGRAIKKPGWSTNKASRPVMINAVRALVRRKDLLLNDVDTIDQMLHFVDDGKKQQHAPGWKDDLVFALLLAVQMAEQGLYLEEVRPVHAQVGPGETPRDIPPGSWLWWSQRMLGGSREFETWAA